MLERKDLIIFDMDGCLIDTESAYAKIWERVFIENHVPIHQDEILTWRGLGWERIRKIIDAVTNDSTFTLELRRRREEIYHEDLFSDRINLKPYTVEILEYYKAKGYKLALGTSTFREKSLVTLNHYGLLKYFDVAVFGDDVANTKPDPAIYNKILSDLNILPEHALIFEDSRHGIMAANNANVEVVYVPDGKLIDTQDLKIKRMIKDFGEMIL